MSPGLVTVGETMGLLVQTAPGSVRNGEAMTFGMGGSESNVAIGIRRLGVPATWIGRVGADPPGDLILRELRAEQVQAITVTDPSPTGLMVRWRPSGAHGRVTYYRRHSAGSHLTPDDIPADVIRSAAVLHVTGITLALGPGPAAAVTRAIAVARDAGVTVSFDLNYRSALWPVHEAAPALEAAVRSADVVFAGEHEAEIVTETADPLGAALALEAMTPAGRGQVVIKRGPEGCLARVSRATLEQPAPAVPVLDTV
ncbi:MAG: sugar kinase, partial [Solirubrobacteraceae bacterium]